ncbi:MAG: hypothetical protein AAF586_05560 [Planctomycetota bacterium]
MPELVIGTGDHRYLWHDHWARVTDGQAGAGNARTHGVCVAKDGTVVVFAQSADGILHFDPDGRFIGKFGGGDWGLAHGLTYIADDSGEYLWLTNEPNGGKVAKTTLTGEVVRDIEPIVATPPGADEPGAYCPTWAAENPVSGEVWVADGYGSSLVHRVGADGKPDLTLTGEEGAGRFACPHGIAFDTRGGKAPELYITDRGNGRIVVYDAAGVYQRTVQHEAMQAPCCFDFLGDLMLVPDLNASVCVYDASDEIVAPDLGVHREAVKWGRGWPNWNITGSPEMVQPGKFNSPHGGCFGPDGSIYIAEWLLGGRVTKLTPA